MYIVYYDLHKYNFIEVKFIAAYILKCMFKCLAAAAAQNKVQGQYVRCIDCLSAKV